MRRFRLGSISDSNLVDTAIGRPGDAHPRRRVRRHLAALDPPPETAPAVIPYRPPLLHDRAAGQDLLAEILSELESMALELYPAWLPAADGNKSLTVQQIRSLAQEHAETRFASALDNLASLSGMGVWLTGAPLLTVTRHPTVAAPRKP